MSPKAPPNLRELYEQLKPEPPELGKERAALMAQLQNLSRSPQPTPATKLMRAAHTLLAAVAPDARFSKTLAADFIEALSAYSAAGEAAPPAVVVEAMAHLRETLSAIGLDDVLEQAETFVIAGRRAQALARSTTGQSLDAKRRASRLTKLR